MPIAPISGGYTDNVITNWQNGYINPFYINLFDNNVNGCNSTLFKMMVVLWLWLEVVAKHCRGWSLRLNFGNHTVEIRLYVVA